MKKILVVGDIMLDRYVYGVSTRISPEAPVPVLLQDDRKSNAVPGGAANVAINIAAAGCEVALFAIVGNDKDGEDLLFALNKEKVDTSYVVKSSSRPTTVKTRYIAQNNQQILRVDNELTDKVTFEELDSTFIELKKELSAFSVIVFSDYNKGFLTHTLIKAIRECAKELHIPIIADVKGTDKTKYEKLYIVKPNRKELEELIGRKTKTLDEVSKGAIELCNSCACNYIVVTCGKHGMIITDNQKELLRLDTVKKEVFDVTGAGDTVLAYIAEGIANGKDILKTIKKANVAAGIQVSKFGTSPVYNIEVLEASKASVDVYERKIVSLKTAKEILSVTDKKTVFTNGCFDILHLGHVKYLSEAACLGELLVIGINSDDSIRRLKGEKRPINSIDQRAAILASLEFVDYVIVFDDDTPYELIKELKPDVLAKGADYKKEEIVGWDVVESYGGEVKTIPLVDGMSTTNIINKIETN